MQFLEACNSFPAVVWGLWRKSWKRLCLKFSAVPELYERRQTLRVEIEVKFWVIFCKAAHRHKLAGNRLCKQQLWQEGNMEASDSGAADTVLFFWAVNEERRVGFVSDYAPPSRSWLHVIASVQKCIRNESAHLGLDHIQPRADRLWPVTISCLFTFTLH